MSFGGQLEADRLRAIHSGEGEMATSSLATEELDDEQADEFCGANHLVEDCPL